MTPLRLVDWCRSFSSKEFPLKSIAPRVYVALLQPFFSGENTRSAVNVRVLRGGRSNWGRSFVEEHPLYKALSAQYLFNAFFLQRFFRNLGSVEGDCDRRHESPSLD